MPEVLFIKLNILIDQNSHARLADFGLLTIVLDSTHHTSSTGTTRWMSPELLDPDRFGRGDCRPTRSSDCYALGMVILEVLTGKPPFPNFNGMVVTRKVVEGERPGRPQGGGKAWFTDDLWEILEQCWLPQPERRPTIDVVLQCVKRGSTAWQPLPPDSDDDAQSDNDDQSHSTLSYDPSIEPSMFFYPVLYLARPQMAFIAGWVDPQDDDRTLVLSQNESRSVSTGQGSRRLSPGSQRGSDELPVSAMSDAADIFVSYDNPMTHSRCSLILAMPNKLNQHIPRVFPTLHPRVLPRH